MLRDITIGQYYPVESKIHRLDPRMKIIAVILYLISLFLFQNFAGYAVVTWCGHRVQSCAARLYHERPETDFVFAFIYGMFPRVFYAGRRCAVSVEIYIDHKRRH